MEAGDKTMKLGRASWIILTVGIIIVAFGSLGIARFQQSKEQEQLQEELSVAELRLEKFQLKQLRSQKEEFEERLDKAISRLRELFVSQSRAPTSLIPYLRLLRLVVWK